MLRHIKHSLRSWLHAPWLGAAIIACIAVSIGGVATLFTLVHGTLLAPLPYPHVERIVDIVTGEQQPGTLPFFSHPDYRDLASRTRSFERLVATTVARMPITTPAGAERVRGEAVSASYFELFGVRMQAGRTFSADEHTGRGDRVIIISDRLWRSHFGADASAIGKTLQTADGPRVLVGITAPGFLGMMHITEGDDIWIPDGQFIQPAQLERRSFRQTRIFGLLREGVVARDAAGELQSLAAVMAREHPVENRSLTIEAHPIGEIWRRPLRPVLTAMLGGSAFLLLIGCGNVAILLLTRMISRERELTVRLCLGASPRHLLVQQTSDALTVCAAGGLAGMMLADWLVGLVFAQSGLGLPAALPVSFSLTPRLVVIALVLAASLLVSILPMLAVLRLGDSAELRPGGRGEASHWLQRGPGRLLVVGQTALAVCLLAGAALFVRSYGELRSLDLGYRTQNLLRAQVTVFPGRYPTAEAQHLFFQRLSRDLAGLPGVRGLGLNAPTLPPYTGANVTLRVRGGELAPPAAELRSYLHFSSNEIFSVLGVPLVAGRWFSEGDARGGPPVALISESLARAIADGAESALGRVLQLPARNLEVTIIGVVRDVLWDGLRDRTGRRQNLFLSLAQFPQSSVGILFDCAVEPRTLSDGIARIVRAADESATLYWVHTVEKALADQTGGDRLWSLLTGVYGLTALLLSLAGLYGVLSHGVASRTREIGIRLALGGTAAQIARMVVGQGLRLVLTGAVVGLGLALLAGRYIQAKLYGITATDPLALAASVALLTAVALLACLLPARRAARTDPLVALRSE